MKQDLPGWTRKELCPPDRGKMTDSYDYFVFYYREIDPRRENFSLSATFVVTDASGVDFQTGYGIMAVDTIAYSNFRSRHRNHALAGRFRTPDGRNYGNGLRIVGGYTDPQALLRDGRRKLDPSRLFKFQDTADAIRNGDTLRLRLAKTDKGLEASLGTDGEAETLFFPGCDFLLRQDKRAFYVGFAIAGKVGLDIRDIRFEKTPGGLSHTPCRAIRLIIPDYPFQRGLLTDPARPGRRGLLRNAPLPVRAEDGSRGLEEALLRAGPGCEIILADGVYPAAPFYIPKSCSGTRRHPVVLRAEHPGMAVIDGSSQHERLPAMTLRASHWILEGLVFRNAPSSGLFLCGSDNVVRQCEACHNGDTGILLCAFPGSHKRDWPARNRVENCLSHDNCDKVRCNADGFGAKLSVGKGNRFYRCEARHNIDDGFDLYTKQLIGPIGPVMLEACKAACNGWLSTEEKPEETNRGSGFKLGGEDLPVAHLVVKCIAHGNGRTGFDANSNPAPVLTGCRAWDNPEDFHLGKPKNKKKK